MTVAPLDPERERHLETLVQYYASESERYSVFLRGLQSVTEMPPLSTYIHSVKARLKHPEHLRDKLRRKAREAEQAGNPFDITTDNLFRRINDLAGLRILHLHTRQMERIHTHLIEALEEAQMPLVEEPFARTWDDESRSYFRSIGIRTQDSESMYTSVHYVVETNFRTKRTGEIQVRTLAEELWGEVDHTINYPHPTTKLACSEQIRVLARVTSSCSRLVDSIFATYADENAQRVPSASAAGVPAGAAAAPPAPPAEG